MTEPEAQPQGGELLPCPFDGGNEVVVGSGSHDGPYVRCFFCDTYIFGDSESEVIQKWNTRADRTRATAETPRKLTQPELNHLSALLEAEKESGEYAGPREQYYARTERLIEWCNEQIASAKGSAS
jgi:hypothetical protein